MEFSEEITYPLPTPKTIKLCQGHQNLTIYYGPINDVYVPVWSKYGQWSRRWGFRQGHFIELYETDDIEN